MAWRHRLETWLHQVWFQGHRPAWPWRILLKMGALLHRWVRHHQQLQQKTQQAKRPIHARKAPLVLVVGNVVVGGAGKTPVVLAAVQHLQARGQAVGIISRGFGRQGNQIQIIHPQHSHQAQAVGDEPLWLAQRTGCPVAVGANRQAALQALLQAYPGLRCVVSDDGLQHHALQRDIEWVVFDERGAGNHMLLPQGPLREPLNGQHNSLPNRLHSVDAILASNISPQDLAAKLHCVVEPHWHGVQVRIQGFVQHNAANQNASMQTSMQKTMLTPAQALQQWAPAGNSIRAFAGLGNPHKWFKALQQMGLNLPSTQTTALPDHFQYPANFCDQFSEAVLITTEKDAVKLAPNPRLWVAIVAVELPPALLNTLDEALNHVG